MKFYRKLAPFKAISFDLDDTLYYNAPVMAKTEAEQQKFFANLLADHPSAASECFDYDYWLVHRQTALETQPELIHGVAEIRQAGYQIGLQALGYSAADAEQYAKQAMALFHRWRSNFAVPSVSHQLLAKLQQQLPLIAISNGNVNTNTINIAQYFAAIYHPGNGVKQKPHPEMFHTACDLLGIAPHELLHVGDCGHSDIRGAVAAGCQTAWLSCYDVGKPLSVLPNVELTDIRQLLKLI